MSDFNFPWIVSCARCGGAFEADSGGVPCSPDHPYYHKWICDECLDQIEAEKEAAKND